MKRLYDGQLVGVSDDNDNVLVRPIYHYLWFADSDYVIVRNFCFYGVVRISDGEEVVPVKYNWVDIKEGYVITTLMGMYGAYKIDGTLLSEPIFSSPNMIPVMAAERRGSDMVSIYP